MSLVTRIVTVTLVIFLSGCSYFSKPSIIQGQDKYYKSAHSVPPMRIAPGMSSNSFVNYYPVPNRSYPPSERTVNIVPPGL